MLDVDDVIDNDLHPMRMVRALDDAITGIEKNKSQEAKWLLNALESFKDECEYVSQE